MEEVIKSVSTGSQSKVESKPSDEGGKNASIFSKTDIEKAKLSTDFNNMYDVATLLKMILGKRVEPGIKDSKRPSLTNKSIKRVTIVDYE